MSMGSVVSNLKVIAFSIVMGIALTASTIAYKQQSKLLDLSDRVSTLTSQKSVLEAQISSLKGQIKTQAQVCEDLRMKPQEQVCESKILVDQIKNLPSKVKANDVKNENGTADIDDKLPADLIRLLK